MTCYSWRGGEGWEGLREHVARALDALRFYEERGYGVLVEQRLGVEDGAGLLRLLVALHDLGKAADGYQGACDAGPCGFRGHEYISAYAAYPVFEGLYGRRVADAAAAAIMLHHHTMRDRLDGVPREWRLRGECLVELGGLVGVDLSRVRAGGSRRGVEGFARPLEGRVRGMFPGVAVLLYPLVVVDNVAAARRGGGGTMVGEEAVRLYGEWRRNRIIW